LIRKFKVIALTNLVFFALFLPILIFLSTFRNDFMTSDRQRLQPFHHIEPGVSSPYNSTTQIYSEENLGDENFSFTETTPYNSDNLINDHSLLHAIDVDASYCTSLQGNCSISNNIASTSMASTSQAYCAHELPSNENFNSNTSFDINTTHAAITYLNPLAGQSEYRKKKVSLP
jgi:hypothetical protein